MAKSLRKTSTLIFLFCCLGLSCDANGPEVTNSGIEGQVIRRPTCPGPITPEDPCEEPFSAKFSVLDSLDTEVASFRSDEQGNFRVVLMPGSYEVLPDSSAPILRPASQAKNVTVNSGEFTRVTLVFDTGIR
ncbi:MAG: hypothetical protein ACE5HO_21490 [bacterium]